MNDSEILDWMNEYLVSIYKIYDSDGSRKFKVGYFDNGDLYHAQGATVRDAIVNAAINTVKD